jgi:hypothetical protein
MTTTSPAPGRALLVIPGTLFWVLVIAGAVTKNNALIGAGVVLLVVTVGLTLTLRLRAHGANKAAEQELWTRGTPARARVVRIKDTGARINRHPKIELELAVTVPDQPPFPATLAAYISTIAIPRVQPDCTIDVRVDPTDRTRVVIDPDLTPGV